MVVKVVTDSTSDLPSQLAIELGITVVPVYLRFGDEVYRDPALYRACPAKTNDSNTNHSIEQILEGNKIKV